MSEESVWDYPRPPRAEPTPKRIRVYFGGELVADTSRAVQVLETSHPPVYYIPRDDVRSEVSEAQYSSELLRVQGLSHLLELGGERQANRRRGVELRASFSRIRVDSRLSRVLCFQS